MITTPPKPRPKRADSRSATTLAPAAGFVDVSTLLSMTTRPREASLVTLTRSSVASVAASHGFAPRCLQTPYVTKHEQSQGLFVFGHVRDRKSTRLNSSHQIISYAVFCLKKKKHLRRSHDDRFARLRPIQPRDLL